LDLDQEKVGGQDVNDETAKKKKLIELFDLVVPFLDDV
jgi:hypothetical protein